jgi:hypothetical protein
MSQMDQVFYRGFRTQFIIHHHHIKIGQVSLEN